MALMYLYVYILYRHVRYFETRFIRRIYLCYVCVNASMEDQDDNITREDDIIHSMSVGFLIGFFAKISQPTQHSVAYAK